MTTRLEPLRDTSELLVWNPGKRQHDELFVCARKLEKVASSSQQKLLVCHDLQGGYGDDSLLHGGKDAEQFALFDWHVIDMFIYFSHSLVTIPPPGWTATAHLHGVQVLGTFITEWDEGERECEKLFGSKTSAERVAEQLASIAEFFGFEGWLINIENPLSADAVENLLHFLGTLQTLMHQQNADAAVIWYDAVTTEGKLQWQDNLTDLNRAFFDVCDGLFVNYTWKAGSPSRAALSAGERAADVYMGVDVFGRGSFGGGIMNSHLAVDASFAAGLSSAVFAPGWVWENARPRSKWKTRSQRLWDPISAVSLKHRPLRPLISTLPFQSSFCQGMGLARYSQGAIESQEPWYSLAEQDFQPQFQDRLQLVVQLELERQETGEERVRLHLTWLRAHVSDGAAYCGGQILIVEGQRKAAGGRRALLEEPVTCQSESKKRNGGFACKEEVVRFSEQVHVTGLNLHCWSSRNDGRVFAEIGQVQLQEHVDLQV